MRLTLRTMLAYMDDILDPADHEDLGKKIEASDFAAELIHRSRDTVRRLRLGAPEVLADESDDVLDGDPAADANAVAEYLDNTLAPERVAEFERCCLDTGTTADMHLAEVTSCHHILTMVLGEPAEIDPALRRRMYGLPERIESGQKLRIEEAHTAHSQAEPPIVSPPAESETVRFEATTPTEVVDPAAPFVVTTLGADSDESSSENLPDYLRVAASGKRRRHMFATAAVLAILGGLTAWVVSDSLRDTKVPDTVLSEVDPEQMDLDISVGEQVPSTAESSPPGVATPGAASPEGDSTTEDTRYKDYDATAVLEDAPSFNATSPLPSAEQATESEPVRDNVALDASVESDTRVSDELEQGSVGVESAPVSPGFAEDLSDLPESESDEIAEEAVASVDPQDIGSLSEDGKPGEEESVPPEPVGPVQVGTYLGNNDVLLRYSPASEEWVRLPPRTAITGGDMLMSLPKYRTHVVLGNINAYLSGGTQITVPEQELSTSGGDQELALEVNYGKLLINAGLKGSDISLQVGNELRDFHLDSSASLAVDVHRVFVPGSDYEIDNAPVEANWYLTSGSVEWKDPSGTESMIRAPATWKTVNDVDDAPEAILDLPRWIDREPMTDLERRARDRFAEELLVGRPVELRLQELNEEKSAPREVKTLSAEASLHVGEFAPFVNSLNDSDQRIAWRSHIEAMRQALARSPHEAEQLHETFIRLRGVEDGENLMQMVRGFSPAEVGTTREEVKQGVVIDLIRWLEHPSLDYRVLAIYNLDEIKGTKDLKDYRPDGLQRSRGIAVAKIRQLVEDNEFLPAR